MGAVASLAMAPLSLAASCCGMCLGQCASSMLCKACSCMCVASLKVSAWLYFGALAFFALLALVRLNLSGMDGDIVLFEFGGQNATAEESIISKMTHHGAQGAFDFWNSGHECAKAHTQGLIVCCASRCAGPYAVYRFSFTLCLFFAFLMLCTIAKTKFGARTHRGFWFLKLFVLLTVLISTVFVDNSAMYAYREVAKYLSFFFLWLQCLLLIDFAYMSNEKLVELDEANPDSDEKTCNWKFLLLVGSVLLYAASIAGWVLESQWFGKNDNCAPQQFFIAMTIIVNIILTIVSCTKIAPHGTLLTSAVVTAYTTYMVYSALASHPDENCNPTTHHSAVDKIVGFPLLVISMISVAASSTSSQKIWGTSASANSDLTVTLEAGAGSSDADGSSGGKEEEEVTPESHWYYHLMMAIVSMYFAMLLTNWSIQPLEPASHPRGGELPDYTHSLASFWVKISAQFVCLAMYAWTLLAPYLLRDIRDFGVEFDF